MFDLWFELPPLLRAGLGLLLLLAFGLIWLLAGRIWFWLGAVGLIFILFSGSGSNSKGYRF